MTWHGDLTNPARSALVRLFEPIVQEKSNVRYVHVGHSPYHPLSHTFIDPFGLFAFSSTDIRSTSCETQICYRDTEGAETVDVNVGSLDSPQSYPPSCHIFTQDQISWFDTVDDLPRRERSEPGAEQT